VLRLAATLPDPLVGLPPDARRGLDLAAERLPELAGEVLLDLDVDVDRVEEGTVDVVLTLVVGGVPYPDGTCPLIALQVVEGALMEVLLPADPVHDLKPLAIRRPVDVGHVHHEIGRLVVEAEGVEGPEGEGRVADPGIAVIPVALAARSLGQRGGEGGEKGAGGGVGESLEGEGGTLQVAAPGVVGEAACREPAPPEFDGAPHPLVAVLHGVRGNRVGAPRECAEAGLSSAEAVPGAGVRAGDTQGQIAAEHQVHVAG
jgi:hypothetical protein